MPQQPDSTMEPSLRRNGRGFTLVELLVAISIIVVLIAILVPALGGARTSARKSSTAALLTTVSTAINQFKSANNRLPGYFSQHELGQSANTTGFTQMENALLEIAGGVAPATAQLADRNIVEIEIGSPIDKRVRINTLAVGGSNSGPGYLSLTAKGLGSNDPQSSGLAPAKSGQDQVANTSVFGMGATAKYQMPDILDAWGKPVILWSRNESPGSDPLPQFADIDAPTSINNINRQALFYWRSNAGYLESPLQVGKSGIASDVTAPIRIRSLAGLLGHPGFPDPNIDAATNPDPVNQPVPLSPRGEFVLHSAGPDQVYLNHRGNRTTEFRYLPAGAQIPAAWSGSTWQTLSQTDDILQGGG